MVEANGEAAQDSSLNPRLPRLHLPTYHPLVIPPAVNGAGVCVGTDNGTAERDLRVARSRKGRVHWRLEEEEVGREAACAVEPSVFTHP